MSRDANVLDLSSYLRKRDWSNATATVVSSAYRDGGWTRADPVASGLLTASVLQRLDPDAELSRFLDVSSRALAGMEACLELLKARDFLGADDQLMATKAMLAELMMFREISDSVGLIALKCLQVASKVKAITDAPDVPEALRQALHRAWASPFMKFDEACDLADKIEDAAASLHLPGYVELTNELVSDARTPEQA